MQKIKDLLKMIPSNALPPNIGKSLGDFAGKLDVLDSPIADKLVKFSQFAGALYPPVKPYVNMLKTVQNPTPYNFAVAGENILAKAKSEEGGKIGGVKGVIYEIAAKNLAELKTKKDDDEANAFMTQQLQDLGLSDA
jgi:hypothetical protein